MILMIVAMLGSVLNAQRDTILPGIGEEDDFQQQLIEDVLANSEDETDEFTFNAAFDLLETYRRRPLNLNKATYRDLEETLLLNPIQIGQLLDYRERMGGLMSIYELQVIPGMDLESVRRLAAFVRVGGDLDDAKIPLGRMLAEGDRELYVRWQRRLERARGYTIGPETGATNYYLGSPDRLYTRFRQRYSNKLSFGITAEKDPGEAFFAENNRKRGFDFYSFMRGAGTTLALGDKVELTLFGSRRGINGNRIGTVAILDTINDEVLTANVSSLNLSGFNRTPNEVVDRNALLQYNYGGSLQYRANQRFHFGLNVSAKWRGRTTAASPRFTG